jgi:hypothetical protein
MNEPDVRACLVGSWDRVSELGSGQVTVQGVEGRYDSRPQLIGSEDGNDPDHLEGAHGSVRSQGAPLACED